MQTAIWNLQGTPDEPKDWTRPDEWIPVRLDGTDREMALAIWEGTDRKVNPRRVYGHWLLATNYDLITPPDSGPITLTKRGQDFVKESGEAEAAVDEGEGLVKLLSIVAERAPAGARDVLVGWADFLKRYSGFRSDSTIRDSLYRRIRNLLERGLISRSASQYSISAAGLTYLQRVGRADEARAPSAQLGGLLTLAAEHRAGVRRELHRILGSMNPYAFEQLVGQLLEAMDYSGVTVT
ncbi:MAG: restriction endonuclease, partial [Polyangiaceae bacterium]|nr:restriction endonuclease [Polyangiaceae bacterium]